jgi:hypothetical protein
VADDICLIHLAWAPLGASTVEAFVAAYRRCSGGTPHRLAVIFNGFRGSGDQRLAAVERALEPIDYEALTTPRAMIDLGAYRWAAGEVGASKLCFVNSYSRPLVDGWLALLASPHSHAEVGITGIGGSYESAYTAAPFWLRPVRRRDFTPFPNPHLRTNGFMVDRGLFLGLDWPAPRRKAAAWALESGKHSMSRQLWARGLEVLVVGRDGVAYPPDRWRDSATFRSGDQHNLLIADNRTEQYRQAAPALRRRLEEMAWGDDGERPAELNLAMPA